MDALRRSLARLGSDQGGEVFVLGEAGIGKTALIQAFSRHALAQGVSVLRGDAVADAGAPAFWPVIRALTGPTAQALGLSADLVSLNKSEYESPAAVRFAAITHAADALFVAASAAAGLVIVLEDLHWADDATLQLVRHLSADLSTSQLMVLATSRDPLPEAVTGLAGSSLLRLAPMTQREVGQFLGAGVHQSWVRAVHERSGGHPLYVAELTRVLDRSELRAACSGLWQLPVDLVHLIAHRLNQLSPGCRRLLDGASVVGEQFDPDLLPSPDGVTEAIDAGVFIDVPGPRRRLRWSHGVVREAWYSRLSHHERTAWHRRLAETLESRGSAQEGELARHRLGAAVDEASRASAVAACVSAAEEAAQRLDFASAVHWYLQTLPLLPDDAARAEVHLAVGRLTYQDGQVSAALEHAQIAADLAVRLGRADLLVEAALVVKGIGGVPLESVLALCQRARSALGDEDSALHARVLAQQARVLADALNVAAARPLSERAMIMAKRCGDRAALMEALHARHEVIGGLDGVNERMALGAQLVQLAAADGRPESALWGHVWRVDAELQLGAVSDLLAELFDLAGLVQRIGWPLARWHLLRARATRALQTGRFDEAAQLALACGKVAAHTQDWAAQVQSGLIFNELHTLTGRYEEHVPRSLPWAESGAQWMPVSLATFGWHELQAGNVDRAMTMFGRVRPMLETLPVNARWMATVMRSAQLAVALDDQETAELTYGLLLPHQQYFGGQSAAYLGAIPRVLGSVASMVGDHAAATFHGATAIEMERRVGAQPFVALAELALARSLILRGGSGDRTQALTLIEQSQGTARRLNMTPTADAASKLAAEINGLGAGPAGLTAREREIAAFLASGKSNREIASELALSERTIETHVHNLLPKLGLKNRTQVAAWALSAGLRAGLNGQATWNH